MSVIADAAIHKPDRFRRRGARRPDFLFECHGFSSQKIVSL